MNMSQNEIAERKAAFHRMSVPEKLDYILSYYKLPLVLILIALIALGTVVIHQVTKKESLLYLGFANVSVGEDLQTHLTRSFVEATGANPKKNQVYTYANLYLSDHATQENHQYSYASKLKMIATINAEQMDLVLMNQEAYDMLSQSGYLLDLTSFLQKESPDLYAQVSPNLVENVVILQDNSIEMELNTADTYQADTETVVNGLDCSDLPFFASAGFQEPVYLCIIANSPRLPAVLDYLAYITAP